MTLWRTMIRSGLGRSPGILDCIVPSDEMPKMPHVELGADWPLCRSENQGSRAGGNRRMKEGFEQRLRFV
jgi:hypothetical protein